MGVDNAGFKILKNMRKEMHSELKDTHNALWGLNLKVNITFVC